MDLQVYSPSFENGDRIPRKHTCQGENISPEICWGGVPAGTRSIVLMMEDPDIPMPRFLIPCWTHWIVYGIGPEETILPEGMPHGEFIGGSARQGLSSYKKSGYSGPCPPLGTHRYFFRIYALDTPVSVEPGSATRKKVLNAMQGHILGRGELMGTYTRQK